jgi:hypothetical protein
VSDPLEAWREAFEAIPDQAGQLTIYLGPNELEQVASREQVEKQVHDAAQKLER